MHKSSFLTVFFALTLHFLFAQSALNTAGIDSVLNVFQQHDKIWGSLSIRQNGQTVYNKATGYAWAGHRMPDAQTQYRIGSITKVFTAVMIMQLVEEGKLGLDATIDQWFLHIPNAGKITVRHLLSHASGLHNFTDDADYEGYMTQPQTSDEMLERFAQLAPDFEPGTKNEYSNTNYVLLGYLIEKLDRRAYGASLQARIAVPLGLKRTAFGKKIDVENNQAESYRMVDNHWAPESETDMSIPHGAGAIVSTPGDLCIFFEALFEGKLLKQSSVQQMCYLKNGYGMGIFQVPFHERRGWFHNGGIDGFQSNAVYFPDDKTAVAFTGNAFSTDLNALMIGVLSKVFGKPYKMPTFQSLSLSDAQLGRCAGNYASDQLPLKFKVWAENQKLMAQATGQSAFPLDADSETEFRFDVAGIKILFGDLRDGLFHTLTIKQAGQSFTFQRE
ncbi:MAG: serine hydrolase domain-containing protein [Saprospiraceae bacterium]|nr:serine hydrolase domain-containing protein [Saprospiraceae bacterium]